VKILLFILLLSPFWARADDHKPNAKEAARIAKIEKDYDVHFVQVIGAASEGVETVYWAFVKMAPGSSFLAFPFAVPANANDQSVTRAIVSSMQTVQFYEFMIKKEKESSQSHITY
jgi:hypothetical protein